MPQEFRDAALLTYEKLAPLYDDFTAGYQAETWTARLEAIALAYNPNGSRTLLDIGCGTGKSFLPMLNRGWRVVGCDISSAMLRIASEKSGDSVSLHCADARDLPVFGQFDLVWALNDSLNYMMSRSELVATLRSMRANLTETGIALFDLSTLRSMREWFTAEIAREINGREVRWMGLADEGEVRPGGSWEARVEVPSAPEANHTHCQRHFPEVEVLELMARAEMECLGVWGDTEGRQSQPLDEERHEKAIYVGRSAVPSGRSDPR